MPWDGFRIMAWLRRFADFKQTPVVLVSIGDPVENARLTIASGATAFFHKQMKPEQLLTMVKVALGLPGREDKPVLTPATQIGNPQGWGSRKGMGLTVNYAPAPA